MVINVIFVMIADQMQRFGVTDPTVASGTVARQVEIVRRALELLLVRLGSPKGIVPSVIAIFIGKDVSFVAAEQIAVHGTAAHRATLGVIAARKTSLVVQTLSELLLPYILSALSSSMSIEPLLLMITGLFLLGEEFLGGHFDLLYGR